MAKAAANVEGAVEARQQFVYSKSIRASLVGGNGRFVCKENRLSVVVPSETPTGKKLVTFRSDQPLSGRTNDR